MTELTIITPTYNREKTLPLVFKSLCSQSYMKFIWLVIDDGSTDNTESLIRSFIDKAEFEIRYYKKENGGKARAINYALDLVDTAYCVCLDSDDTFSATAIEKAVRLLHEEDNNAECCGIIGLRHNPDNTVMGGKEIPQSYKYASITDIYNCNIRSEFNTFYKSHIVKKYRFPEIDGEKFISPAWFHYKLSEKYKFRIVRDIICYCEYLEDGMTKNKRRIIADNPNGYTLVKRMSFKYSVGLRRKIKNGIMYDCGCIISKNNNWLKDAPHKFISIICYPFGLIIYLKKFKKIKLAGK